MKYICFIVRMLKKEDTLLSTINCGCSCGDTLHVVFLLGCEGLVWTKEKRLTVTSILASDRNLFGRFLMIILFLLLLVAWH